MSHIIEKPALCKHKQQRHRLTSASIQSDQSGFKNHDEASIEVTYRKVPKFSYARKLCLKSKKTDQTVAYFVRKMQME